MWVGDAEQPSPTGGERHAHSGRPVAVADRTLPDACKTLEMKLKICNYLYYLRRHNK